MFLCDSLWNLLKVYFLSASWKQQKEICIFVELNDCQLFLVNFILSKLFQFFLPECILILLSVLSSVYTQVLNVRVNDFNQFIHYVMNIPLTGRSTFPVLLRVCLMLSVAVTITSSVVGLHINEAISNVFAEFGQM